MDLKMVSSIKLIQQFHLHAYLNQACAVMLIPLAFNIYLKLVLKLNLVSCPEMDLSITYSGKLFSDI